MVRPTLGWFSSLSLLTIISSATSLNIVQNNKLNVKNWGMPLAGQKLNIAPLATVTVKNRFKCISKCTETEGCISINFGPKVGEEHACELLGQDRYVMAFNMTVDVDWTYMAIKTKCDKNPCGMKMCVPDYINDDYNCIGKEDKNCQDLLKKGIVSSGLLLVYLVDTFTPVYCDQVTDGGGWLVIQRNDWTMSFAKTWEDYKQGFGNLFKSFWWGNEKIYQITARGEYDMRIDLKKSDGDDGFGEYTQFQLSSEQDNYRLYLNATAFTGTIGDALTAITGANLLGKSFTTMDEDNDESGINCATSRGGGWWYTMCSQADLNANSVEWRTWTNYQLTIFSEMKIRPGATSN